MPVLVAIPSLWLVAGFAWLASDLRQVPGLAPGALTRCCNSPVHGSVPLDLGLLQRRSQVSVAGATNDALGVHMHRDPPPIRRRHREPRVARPRIGRPARMRRQGDVDVAATGGISAFIGGWRSPAAALQNGSRTRPSASPASASLAGRAHPPAWRPCGSSVTVASRAALSTSKPPRVRRPGNRHSRGPVLLRGGPRSPAGNLQARPTPPSSWTSPPGGRSLSSPR